MPQDPEGPSFDETHDTPTPDGEDETLALRAPGGRAGRVPGIVGQRIGRYRLLEEIGHGGQGYVYRALDTQLNRPVAVKLLATTLSFSERARMRFLREAEAASKLDHPGICTVHEVGDHEGLPYIAMRYVPGKPLSYRIASTRATIDTVPVDRSDGESDASTAPETPGDPSLVPRSREDIDTSLELVARIADALHVAHEAGLVHRDIKPGNIMVDEDGRPVILDFGLARQMGDDAPTLTRTGEFMGTPAYTAPEQLRADVQVDRRADVYALGVVLFECLTLRRPFHAPTRDGLYRAIMGQEPPNVLRLNPAIPRDVKAVLETALAKERDRRYQTAADMASDLRAVLEGRPVSVKHVSTLARGWRWARRNPAPASLAAALIIGVPTIALLVGVLVAKLPEMRKGREQIESERVERALEAGFLELGDGALEEAVATFGGSARDGDLAPEARAGLALAHLRAGRAQEAADVIDAAWSHDAPALAWVRLDVDERLGRPSGVEPTEPISGLGYFLRAVRDTARGEAGDRAAFRRALSDLERAIKYSDRPRALYHLERAHVAGHIGDEAVAREAARILQMRWPMSPVAHIWQGYALHRFDPEAALAAYERAMALDETFARPYNYRGRMLIDQRDFNAAEADFRRAIELDPGYHQARAGLGAVLFSLDRAEEAIPILEKVVRENGYTPACYMLARSYGAVGREDDAMSAFEDLVARQPLHARGWSQIGLLRRKKGLVREAVNAFRRALKADPTLVATRRILAEVLFDSGRTEEGLAAFRTHLKANPDDRAAHTAHAFRLGKLQRDDDALASYRRAAEIRDDAELRRMMSMLHERKGDFGLAADELSRATALSPDDPELWTRLGAALRRSGRKQEGRAAYEKALGADADYAQAHYSLAVVAFEEGRRDDAIAGYRRAVELDPNHARAWNNLGILLRRRGDAEASAEAFARAVAADPTHFRAWSNLGNLRLARGDVDGAVAAYREALKIRPSYKQALNNLGDALRERGDEEEALKVWVRAAALEPRSATLAANLGVAFRHRARYEEALDRFEEANELGARRKNWDASRVEADIAETKRLQALAARLDSVRAGDERLDSAEDRLTMAWIASRRDDSEWAGRLYRAVLGGEASTVRPNFDQLADAAAVAITRAATDANEAAEWRALALAWLRRALAGVDVDGMSSDRERVKMKYRLMRVLSGPAMAPARALDKLPPSERSAWDKLARDLTTLRDI